MGLSVKRIARITTPGRYADGHGLYLQWINEKNQSWLFRFQLRGRQRWAGLGPVHTYNLEEARELARLARQQVKQGIDPLAAKAEAKEQRRIEEARAKAEAAKRVTFEKCAEAFLRAHSAGWTNAKHRAQWLQSLEAYVYPVIGKLFVSGITTAHVVKVLERDGLWNLKRETARRVLNRIERILNFATASEFRTGDNPASWEKRLKDLMPSNGKDPTEHFAALPYDEVPAFMQELRQREGSGRALEFTILTAARTAEVTGATWDEIDFAAKVWTIPAERMKAGKEHRVPLSPTAIALLQSLRREEGNAHVFIGRRPGTGLSLSTMASSLGRMRRTDITVHGFRSSFRQWVAEKTNYPDHVAEQALAHSVDTATVKAYKRKAEMFERRRKLMEAWAAYCASTPVVAAGDNVVALAR